MKLHFRLGVAVFLILGLSMSTALSTPLGPESKLPPELVPPIELRTSVTGSVFKRNSDFISLGTSYQDSSGLVWGDRVIADGGNDKSYTHEEAVMYCRNMRLRLPRIEEFGHLAEDLGSGLHGLYSPLAREDGKDVLPDLSEYNYWSSSIDPRTQNAYAFSGRDGVLFSLAPDAPGQLKMSLRCVRHITDPKE